MARSLHDVQMLLRAAAAFSGTMLRENEVSVTKHLSVPMRSQRGMSRGIERLGSAVETTGEFIAEYYLLPTPWLPEKD